MKVVASCKSFKSKARVESELQFKLAAIWVDKTTNVPSNHGKTDLECVRQCEVDSGPGRDRDVDVDELSGDVAEGEEGDGDLPGHEVTCLGTHRRCPRRLEENVAV